MPAHRSAPPSAQAAVSSGGGCLSGFLLPPLAVLAVGFLLGCLALASTGAPVSSRLTPGGGILSPVFTPEVRHWAAAIQRWSDEAGLDPDLVATVMQIESCGDPRALSRAGARGLFQVMPYHFSPGEDPYDPETNARRGLDYLRRALQTAGGEARLALAGYNGGIGVIGRGESTWAAETQRYAYWGGGIYAEASSGAAQSSRLQEWLAAGGAGLCRQASRRLGLTP